jgi:hypothetical protein
MDMLSDKLKVNAVKINCSIGGVGYSASGIVYVTSNLYDYNYVLTAKHTFQEDSETELNKNKIIFIEIFYEEAGVFRKIEYIKSKEIKDRLIDFDDDFVIVIIKKNPEIIFNSFLVSDKITSDKFYSWSISKANSNQLQLYNYSRNDTENKRFKLDGTYDGDNLPGLSGAGLFSSFKSVLYGVVNKYPNKGFHNSTIDCSKITFLEINERLCRLGKAQLDLEDSKLRHKRIIGEEVVDIHQAFINGVCLDLELARKRLETDIKDDWYYDPLRYIDCLDQDYLFKLFETYFGKNKYVASHSEQFFVPKKTYTLRQALVSPFIDRIMYMAAVGVIAEKIDRALIPNVYSARYNHYQDNHLIINGVEQWKKMKYKIDSCLENYGCIIKIDLLNYYDNINKQLLHEKILRVCETQNETDAAILLNKILKKITTKAAGLPQNSDASSLLASFYLNQVDVYMQHQAKDYYRFMDDIIIFCNDKYEGRRLLQNMETELRRCYLSVNSQKTKIIELTTDSKIEFKQKFDLNLNKIRVLRKSCNFNNRNLAFHASVKLMEKSFETDTNKNDEEASRFNFALNTFVTLAKKGMWSYSDTNFNHCLNKTIRNMLDEPWITTQICNVLNLIPKENIEIEHLKILSEIVIDSKYNTYSLQTYQIWLLLAKHRYETVELKQFAVRSIETNNDTIKPTIAGMIIYLCSIDSNFKRVILRKYGEGFTHGYFQNRIALICLRWFPTDIIPVKHMIGSLSKTHEFLHKYKNKDLVYIPSITEDTDLDEDFEQLYSI